jgi:hypothetical protein
MPDKEMAAFDAVKALGRRSDGSCSRPRYLHRKRRRKRRRKKDVKKTGGG